MSSRIKQLEQFIVEDPDDPFNFYALGLEYLKLDAHKSVDIFTALMKDHKNYIPTYYQLAKLYESLGQKENALKIFNEGIHIAKLQNDLKTLHELRAGLEELEDC